MEMKRIFTQVPYYYGLKVNAELTVWLDENVGPKFTAWNRYPWGKGTEIRIQDESLAPMVALRWT